MICVHDFPHGEVLVKVGVMEFGLNAVVPMLCLYTISNKVQNLQPLWLVILLCQ